MTSEVHPMADRAGLLVEDVDRIPAAVTTAPGVEVVVEALGRRTRAPRRVVLTGLGSSRFAAMAIVGLLREAGLDAVVEHASSRHPAPVVPGDLVVGISASGRTPETVAAVRRAREAGVATLAITSVPGSPLVEAAEGTLTLGSPPEASGIASTGYAATVASLAALAEALGAHIDAGAARTSGAEAAAAVLATRYRWLAAAADALDGGEAIHVIAETSSVGTAEQAALLFREAPRLAADATDAGDWLHVGVYTALPGYRAVLLAGTPYDAELVRTITRRGGRVLGVGPARALAAFEPELTARLALPDVLAGEPGPERRIARALTESAALALVAAELWRRVPLADAPGQATGATVR